MPSSPDATRDAPAGFSGRSVRLIVAALLFSCLAATASADGDPRRGEKIYERCAACHSLDRDRTGPRHEGLIGRRAGSVPGFAYSPAMKKAGAAGMVWDETTLDRFLENPMKAVPGTLMGYAGVKDAQERADLIAFLIAASSAR